MNRARSIELFGLVAKALFPSDPERITLYSPLQRQLEAARLLALLQGRPRSEEVLRGLGRSTVEQCKSIERVLLDLAVEADNRLSMALAVE